MTDDEYEKLRARYRDPPKTSPLDVLFLVAIVAIVVWLVWFVWEQHETIEAQHKEQRALLTRCVEERAQEKYWNCKK